MDPRTSRVVVLYFLNTTSNKYNYRILIHMNLHARAYTRSWPFKAAEFAAIVLYWLLLPSELYQSYLYSENIYNQKILNDGA